MRTALFGIFDLYFWWRLILGLGWGIVLGSLGGAELHSQGGIQVETPNIRIDPVWTATLEGAGFVWAVDLKVDAYGNSYVTGWVEGGLRDGDGALLFHRPIGVSGRNNYFLAKVDKEGRLLWLRHAVGDSRPARICLDEKGDVVVVGMMYGDKLTLTSIDTFAVKMLRNAESRSGVFIVKYDPSGRILRHHVYGEGHDVEVADFVIDSKGNYCIAGNYHYQLRSRPGISRNSYLLMKLSTAFELLERVQGDTIGESRIFSIAAGPKEQLYATGGYWDCPPFASLARGPKSGERGAFLAKFKSNFREEWTLDLLSVQGPGAGVGVVCGRQGDCYAVSNLANGGLNFIKVDASGKILWQEPVKGWGSTGISSMVIDPADHVYLAGEGYGGLFGSHQAEPWTYKSHGGTDVYFAKYNAHGELIWLRACGGRGTDYCKAIALYGEDLLGFGWFGSDLEFHEKVIAQGRESKFWLAKFGQAALDSIDRGPQRVSQRSIAAEAASARLKVNPETCTCVADGADQGRYMPRFQDFDEATAYFAKQVKWKPLSQSDPSRELYIANLYSNSSFGNGGYSFTVVAKLPMRFLHPEGTYGLNLTPCSTQPNLYSVPMHVGTSDPWRRNYRSAHGQEFDSTTSAYVNALLSATYLDWDELLYNILFEGDSVDFPAELTWLSEHYGLEAQVDSLEPEDLVDAVLEALEDKEMGMESYFLDRWLEAGDGAHRLTEDEYGRLSRLFGRVMPPDPVKRLHAMMTLHVRAGLQTPRLGIEISERILRKWEGGKIVREVDAAEGERVPIVATVSDLSYENGVGVEAVIDDVCAGLAEVAGTGVQVKLQKVRLLDTERSRQLHLFHYPAPGAIPKSLWMRSLPDSLEMDRFSGLWVEKAHFRLPFDGKYVEAEALEMVVNNHLFAATLELPAVVVAGDGAVPPLVRLPTSRQGPVETTLDGLAAHFRGLGFSRVQCLVDAHGRLLLQLVKVVP